jgi:hypothetical protein
MSSRNTAQALVWVVVLGLALAVDGMAVGSPTLVVWGLGLAVPATVVARVASRSRRNGVRPAPAVNRNAPTALVTRRPPLDAGRIDLYRWENEGGAARSA